MRIQKPVRRLADYPALAIILFTRACANTFIRCLRFLLFGATPKQVSKILIFRTGSLGDSICALPAIAQIKKQYPEAKLDILTNAGASNLVSIQKLLHENVYNEIIDYYGSSVPELTKQVKNNCYDLIIELPQYDVSFFRLVRNMIFFRLKTGIKKGFGWQLDNIKWFKKAQYRKNGCSKMD
jgi:ADP-heptose:LPS heptosyltransferase